MSTAWWDNTPVPSVGATEAGNDGVDGTDTVDNDRITSPALTARWQLAAERVVPLSNAAQRRPLLRAA